MKTRILSFLQTKTLRQLSPRQTQSATPPARRRTLAIGTLLALGSILAPPVLATAYVSPTTATEYPGAILRQFDKPAQNWLSGHRGVDLEASVGQIIFAAGDGTVAFAGKVAGTPVISIDHVPDKRTTYQPVHAYVKKGDTVMEGQPIGYLAPSTDGYPGLHWGLLTGKDQYENPLSLLERPVIRLKPVDGHS